MKRLILMSLLSAAAVFAQSQSTPPASSQTKTVKKHAKSHKKSSKSATPAASKTSPSK